MPDHVADQSVSRGASDSASASLILNVSGDAAFEPTADFFEALRGRLASLERIEIVGAAPLASKTVHGVLQLLGEPAGSSPTLPLRMRAVADADEARRLLAEVPKVTIRLEVEDTPDFSELRRCAELSCAIGSCCEVELLVSPSNWYDIGPLMAACDEAHAKLTLRTKET